MMPIATRENLAMKLRQNWLTKHPTDHATAASGLDDSLTSLSWLQNLNIMTITTPTPPASPEPFTEGQLMSSYSSASQVDPNAVLQVRVKQEPGLATTNLLKLTSGQHHSLMAVATAGGVDVASPVGGVLGGFDKIDYKNNPYVKPPYSYATLICMAMRETKTNKITLSGIYNWITENFVYYRNADPSWQNSIRHNLSLNKCFQKVARRKDEPGKGGFWKINPEYSDMFVNGIFKKRRGSLTGRETFMPTMPPAKRCRTDDSPRPLPGMKGDTIFHIGADSISDVLDISWNTTTLLGRDIDVAGVRVKTEDIIDMKENVAAVGTITPLSPPTSDGDTDVGLDDLLGAGLDFEDPLDLSTGSPLDLTVQGTCIRPPDWWSDSAGRDMFVGMLSPRQLNHNNGMNTPIPASPVLDSDVEFGHPWAEDRLELDQALASFGGDMFDLEGIEPLSSSEHS